jgi:D-tyrosyl-tRNA(Tyr) deacylase
MRIVIQRVSEAKLEVESKILTEIKEGIIVFVGFYDGDNENSLDDVAEKILNLKLWEDKSGAMWKESVKSLNYDVLVVPNFTLYAGIKGSKLDFHLSMKADKSKIIFQKFVESFVKKYSPDKIKQGEFGAHMKINQINDGPVNIEINLEDTKEKGKK